MNLSKWEFLFISQLIIFLLGWPLDWTVIIIIFVPIFLPLLEIFQVNPYFFKVGHSSELISSILWHPNRLACRQVSSTLQWSAKHQETTDWFILPFLTPLLRVPWPAPFALEIEKVLATNPADMVLKRLRRLNFSDILDIELRFSCILLFST